MFFTCGSPEVKVEKVQIFPRKSIHFTHTLDHFSVGLLCLSLLLTKLRIFVNSLIFSTYGFLGEKVKKVQIFVHENICLSDTSNHFSVGFMSLTSLVTKLEI